MTPQCALLTTREEEVMVLLAAGREYKEIATTLGSSPHTVGAHIRSIYLKLRVSNRVEAINAWKRIAA